MTNRAEAPRSVRNLLALLDRLEARQSLLELNLQEVSEGLRLVEARLQRLESGPRDWRVSPIEKAVVA